MLIKLVYHRTPLQSSDLYRVLCNNLDVATIAFVGSHRKISVLTKPQGPRGTAIRSLREILRSPVVLAYRIYYLTLDKQPLTRRVLCVSLGAEGKGQITNNLRPYYLGSPPDNLYKNFVVPDIDHATKLLTTRLILSVDNVRVYRTINEHSPFSLDDVYDIEPPASPASPASPALSIKTSLINVDKLKTSVIETLKSQPSGLQRKSLAHNLLVTGGLSNLEAAMLAKKICRALDQQESLDRAYSKISSRLPEIKEAAIAYARQNTIFNPSRENAVYRFLLTKGLPPTIAGKILHEILEIANRKDL